jgi:hypothetical protein
MLGPLKYGRRFWLAVIALSIGVHLIFCLQAFAALASGGCMVLGRFFYFLFYPQFMSTVFLCPDTMAFYGFGDGISSGIELVGWPRYLKWLAAAYPASLIYGVVSAEAWRYIRRWREDERHAA